MTILLFFFFFSSRRRHTRYWRDWSSDVCSSDLEAPIYLRRLESTEGRAVADDAAVLGEALRGDCHTHSDWSDGGSSILEMAEAARSLGHEYVALTDHSPRLTVARGLSAERLRQQLEEVEGLNAGL